MKHTISSLIEQYASIFPFIGFAEQQIQQLSDRVGNWLPEILVRLYRQIGFGDTFLTGCNLVLDWEGKIAAELEKQLSDKWQPNEVLIPIARGEEAIYFIRNVRTIDPLVYCSLNNFADSQELLLSEIVRGFACIDDPSKIHQSVADRYWFNYHIPNNREWVALKDYRKWLSAGRPGMPIEYRGFKGDESFFESKVLWSRSDH